MLCACARHRKKKVFQNNFLVLNIKKFKNGLLLSAQLCYKLWKNIVIAQKKESNNHNNRRERNNNVAVVIIQIIWDKWKWWLTPNDVVSPSDISFSPIEKKC